ncbi:hypothetical protein NFI96_009798 [Prochilodus magdalenae]|nr:hypothetical protein NFI96_009798 [Prochilodus magdalenae]
MELKEAVEQIEMDIVEFEEMEKEIKRDLETLQIELENNQMEKDEISHSEEQLTSEMEAVIDEDRRHERQYEMEGKKTATHKQIQVCVVVVENQQNEEQAQEADRKTPTVSEMEEVEEEKKEEELLQETKQEKEEEPLTETQMDEEEVRVSAEIWDLIEKRGRIKRVTKNMEQFQTAAERVNQTTENVEIRTELKEAVEQIEMDIVELEEKEKEIKRDLETLQIELENNQMEKDEIRHSEEKLTSEMEAVIDEDRRHERQYEMEGKKTATHKRIQVCVVVVENQLNEEQAQEADRKTPTVSEMEEVEEEKKEEELLQETKQEKEEEPLTKTQMDEEGVRVSAEIWDLIEKRGRLVYRSDMAVHLPCRTDDLEEFCIAIKMISTLLTQSLK